MTRPSLKCAPSVPGGGALLPPGRREGRSGVAPDPHMAVFHGVDCQPQQDVQPVGPAVEVKGRRDSGGAPPGRQARQPGRFSASRAASGRPHRRHRGGSSAAGEKRALSVCQARSSRERENTSMSMMPSFRPRQGTGLSASGPVPFGTGPLAFLKRGLEMMGADQPAVETLVLTVYVSVEPSSAVTVISMLSAVQLLVL